MFDGQPPRSLPSPVLIVLVGPAGSGKSTWVAERYLPEQIVSLDGLRARVGDSEHDMRASADALAIATQIVRMRLGRGLTAVVDAVNLDAAARAGWRSLAAEAGVPCAVVVMSTPGAVVRALNRARRLRVPEAVLRSQLSRWPAARAEALAEPFDVVIEAPPPPEPGRVGGAPRSSSHRLVRPDTRNGDMNGGTGLRFGLQIPRFAWAGGPQTLGPRLAEVAQAAEAAGFDQLWMMDHFRQIPTMGPAWEDMPESWTTLSYLAGVTSTIRLGTLVSGLTYRNLAHLARIVATLDVMSGGRALCGIGLGWYRQEHDAYGWRFPSVRERYDLLRDALELFPLMWGPGTPRFEGRTVTVTEATCYPRPIQARIPILVGGSGERTTLRIVARSADACNLFGDPATVARKVEVLRRHCEEVGRDPAQVEVTQLSTVLVGDDRGDVAARIERLRPRNMAPERFARTVFAGTADDLVERAGEYRRTGVDRWIVSLADLSGPSEIERFAPLIAAVQAG